MNVNVETFIKRTLTLSTMFAFGLSFLLFVVIDKTRGPLFRGQNLLITLLFFIVCWLGAFMFFMATVHVYISKQQKLLNRDVLFVGRYLLIKLQSGVPFYQALIDAANGGFGTTSKYMREIVDDIELGTPIEQALTTAADISPSKEFRQILWQVNAALRSGVDVTDSLKSILNEIASAQIIEVERYGKKLSTISLLYMLGAIVIPSLGVTLFVAFSGFLGIVLTFNHLVIVLFAFMFVQYMFLSLFKTIRPQINL